MNTPALLAPRTIRRGASFRPALTLKLKGVALGLVPAVVDVVLRLKHRPSAAVVVTRTKSVAGQTSWVTDGNDGSIRFLFTPAETVAATMPAGEYDVDLIYTDSTAPATKTLHATGVWTFVDPKTGAI